MAGRNGIIAYRPEALPSKRREGLLTAVRALIKGRVNLRRSIDDDRDKQKSRALPGFFISVNTTI